MYWLTQDDPIYKHNLLVASFIALDELFPEKGNREQTESAAEEKNQVGNQKDQRRNGMSFLGRFLGLHPTNV